MREFPDRSRRQFWNGIGAEPDSHNRPKQEIVARRARVPQSAVSRGRSGGRLTLDMLLVILKETRTPWNWMPPVPENHALHLECYAQAICYAQQEHDQWFSRSGAGPATLCPRAFQCLLWLFREQEWFFPATPLARRDAIAAAIGARVQKHCAACPTPQGATEPAPVSGGLADKDDVEVRTDVLREYQRAFGAGWMLAIECIPYRWEVCREQHP